MLRPISLAVTSLFLFISACGGGSGDDRYSQAIDAADAKEALARALGSERPCAGAQECGNLALLQPATVCPNWIYKPYSLVSPSASAASAAAAEQVQLAGQAIALAPPSGIACAALINAPPILACVANACKANP